MLDKDDIAGLERRKRAALINCLPGFKPVVLVGTADTKHATNLSIINSCFHVGAAPALLGMIIRPAPAGTERHTLDNILATGQYTINAVNESMTQRAHHTSARFDRGQSEFDACGLSERWLDGHAAPFVTDSPLQIGLTLQEHQPLAINGTHLIIGSVESIQFASEAWRADGTIDLALLGIVTGVGLDGYHLVGDGHRYAYAKPDTRPELI